MLSEYGKFKILYEKNWKLQLKRKKQLIVEILLPFVIGCLLLSLENLVSKESVPESIFDEFDTTTDKFFRFVKFFSV